MTHRDSILAYTFYIVVLLLTTFIIGNQCVKADDTKTFRSGSLVWDFSGGNVLNTQTILKVSAGRTFLLTDILVTPTAVSGIDSPNITDDVSLMIFEDNELIIPLYKPHRQFSFNSCVPFAPGSNVIISRNSNMNLLYGVTVSGYEIDSDLNTNRSGTVSWDFEGSHPDTKTALTV